MIPQKKVINVQKLEKVLLSNWADILEYRVLLECLRETVSPKKIQKFTISRFEICPKGFILWIETTLSKRDNHVNNLFEFFLSNDGDLILIKSDYV